MFDRLFRKITAGTYTHPKPVGINKETVADHASKNVPPCSISPVKAATEELQLLLDRCGMGDAAAMAALASDIKHRHPDADGWMNLWIVRAAIYGDGPSQKMVMQKLEEQPTFLKTLPISWQNFVPGKRDAWRSGTYPGKILNEAGLLSFQPDRMYLLAGLNKDRFMVIWEEDDYDSPDEDGFGAEEYYNMFCLDEFYQPILGVPMMKSVSSRDIHYVSSCKKIYENMISMARQNIHARSQFPLWLDFIPSVEQ